MSLQKFYQNNIYTTFIKSLLYNFNTPTIDTISSGDFLIKDFDYIIGNQIVHCTKSGYYIDEQTIADSSMMGLSLDEMSNKDRCDYEFIQYYTFGDKIINLTKRYVPKASYYDADIHKHFGNYLRALRDVKKIDLMSMYNCFSYQQINGIEITNTGAEISDNEKNKLFAIPIKFNQKYTLAIDCMNVKIMPILINNEGPCKFAADLLVNTSKYQSFFKPSVISSMSINTPYMYEFSLATNNISVEKEVTPKEYARYTGTKYIKTGDPIKYIVVEDNSVSYTDTVRSMLYKNQKYLHLLIQMPKGNKSSIICLEGDYTSTPEYIADVVSIDNASEQVLTDNLHSAPLLLNNQLDTTSYAFNTKIIPYLLHHTVTNQEWIDENISTIQKLLNYRDEYIFEDGVWSNKVRYLLYKLYINSDYRYSKYDIIGFYDTLTERYLHDRFDKEKMYRGK